MASKKLLRVKQFVVKKEVGLSSLYRNRDKYVSCCCECGIGRKGI